MKKTILAATFLAMSAAGASWAGGETASNPEAEVYFLNLTDGATVSSPVQVIFGLRGMGVAPAGTEKEMTGHHHLLIDRSAMGEGADGAEELTYGIPADEMHKHFGGGQTETSIELAPGKHTLQLVLGDLNHVPHATPIMSEVITIIVE